MNPDQINLYLWPVLGWMFLTYINWIDDSSFATLKIQIYDMERTLDNGNTGDIADHLVIPTVSRKTISTQDLTDCDNNRTSAIFGVPDNISFVGVITQKRRV